MDFKLAFTDKDKLLDQTGILTKLIASDLSEQGSLPRVQSFVIGYKFYGECMDDFNIQTFAATEGALNFVVVCLQSHEPFQASYFAI